MSELGNANEWAEIIEPRSQQRMFVNLITGECTWQLPPDTPFQPASGSQWWELFDVASKRYYYYHVASQRTVWQRPRDVNAGDIVSLARIQMPQGAGPLNPLQLPTRTGSAHSHSRAHAHGHRADRDRPHRHDRDSNRADRRAEHDASNAANPARVRTRTRDVPVQDAAELQLLEEAEQHDSTTQHRSGSKCSHGRCSTHHHRRRTRESRQHENLDVDAVPDVDADGGHRSVTVADHAALDQLDGPPLDPPALGELDSQVRRPHHRCVRHHRPATDASQPRRSSADALIAHKAAAERTALPKRQATVGQCEATGSPLERERFMQMQKSVDSQRAAGDSSRQHASGSFDQADLTSKNRVRRAHRLRRGAQRADEALAVSSSEEEQARAPLRKPPLAPLPRRASDSDELDSASDCAANQGVTDAPGVREDETAGFGYNHGNEQDAECGPFADCDGGGEDEGDGEEDGDGEGDDDVEGEDERDEELDEIESESDGSLEETVQRIISDVNALQLQVGGGAQPAAVSPRIAQLQQSLLAPGATGIALPAQPQYVGSQQSSRNAQSTGQLGSPNSNTQTTGAARQQASKDGALHVQTAAKSSPVQAQAPAVTRRPQFPRTNPTISSRAAAACKAGSLSPSNSQLSSAAAEIALLQSQSQPQTSHNNSSASITSSTASITTNMSRTTGTVLLSEGDSGFSTMPQAPNAPLQLAAAAGGRRAQSGSPFTAAGNNNQAGPMALGATAQPQQFMSNKPGPAQQQQQQNVQVTVPTGFCFAGGIFVSPSSSSSSSAGTVASGQSSASGSSTVSSGSFGYVPGESQSHPQSQTHSVVQARSHAGSQQSGRKTSGSQDQRTHAQGQSAVAQAQQSTMSHSASAGAKPHRRSKQSHSSHQSAISNAQAQMLAGAAFMQQVAPGATGAGQNMSNANANISSFIQAQAQANAAANNGGRPLSMFMSLHPHDSGLIAPPQIPTAFQNSSFGASDQSMSVAAQPLFQQPFSLTSTNMGAPTQHGRMSAGPSASPAQQTMAAQFMPVGQQFGPMAMTQQGQFAQMQFGQGGQPQFVQLGSNQQQFMNAQAGNMNANGFAQLTQGGNGLAQFMQQGQQFGAASQRSPVSHLQRLASVQLPAPPGSQMSVMGTSSNAKPPSRSSSSSSGIPPNMQQNAKQMAVNDNMGTLPISCAGMLFRKVHHPPPPPPAAYASEFDESQSVTNSNASFGGPPLNIGMSSSPTPSCTSPEAMLPNPLEQFLEENRKPSKKGLFTKQKSASSLLSFSKDPLTKPLLLDSKDKQVRKELLEIFRCIQQYMGDRKFDGDDSQMMGTSGSGQNGAVDSLLELVCDVLIGKGWQTADIRDEIYLQIGKQLSNNASLDSLLRGWELLGIALDFFSPSPRLRPFLDDFIQRHVPSAANVQAFAQFALSGELAIFAVRRYAVQAGKRLARISKIGRRKLIQRPAYADVQQSRQTLHEISMFGTSLDELIEIQKERGMGDRQLPWIQTALSEEILRLRGTETEGIFRLSADCDEVARLRCHVEKWALPPGLSDPHVPASLLKLFYRELSEPLIPAAVYPSCIEAHNDAAACVRIVEEQLPALNRLVLSYLVRFLQVFCVAENVAHTKMDINNLAMVMAPNIMRCESDDPDTMFNNTRMEMQFLRNVIQHLDTSCVEGIL